jgi:hypothetical protein
VGAIETVPFFGGYFRHGRHAALKVEFEAAVGAVTKYGIVAQFLMQCRDKRQQLLRWDEIISKTVEGNPSLWGLG